MAIIIDLVLSVFFTFFLFWVGVALLVVAISVAGIMILRHEKLGINSTAVRLMCLALVSMVIVFGLQIAWYLVLKNGAYTSYENCPQSNYYYQGSYCNGEVKFEEDALFKAGILILVSWVFYAVAIIITGVFAWAQRAFNNATVRDSS